MGKDGRGGFFCFNSALTQYRYLWEREQPTEARSLFAYGLLLPINISSRNYAHACRLLGHIALDLAQPKAALSAYQQALEIRQEIEKANSPPIADIYESIACSFTEQGNVLEAFKHLEKAETIHAEHDPLRMARTCAISAMTYLRAEQPDEALVALKKCWELQGLTEDQIIGSSYPKHNGDLVLLARIKYAQGLHSEAQQLAVKTISLRRDVYGDKSPRVADSMFLVARMQYASDQQTSTEVLGEIVQMSCGEKELQAHLDRSLWFLENPEQLPMSKKGKQESQHMIPWMLW